MNLYEIEIIAIACLKIVHTIYMQGLLKKCKEALNCFVTAACIFASLSEEKLTFSTKIELVTQAYTKIPMGAQDNFSQSKQGCCKWQTLVGKKNYLCTQGNLCIGITFFIDKSYVEYAKVFNCVLTQTGFSL